MDRKAEAEVMNQPAEVDAYVRGDFAAVNQAFAERLVELAGPRESAKCIDLGTGPADIPIRVARLRPLWTITAVDASAPMLEAAARAVRAAKLEHAVELVLADAKDTKLPAASFDIVFSNSILHHVSSSGAFWKEVRRLAKPHALLFIRDLARPESDRAARAIVEKHAGAESALLQQEFYNSLLSAYTVAEVEAQLKVCSAGVSPASPSFSGLSVKMNSDRHLDVFGTMS
jgi:ubiquinone/menaquinone biosynthesis C-methylase UbiE